MDHNCKSFSKKVVCACSFPKEGRRPKTNKDNIGIGQVIDITLSATYDLISLKGGLLVLHKVAT